jgi:hypothetical protein
MTTDLRLKLMIAAQVTLWLGLVWLLATSDLLG